MASTQVRLARVKLQHDFFDRRYRVFEATRRMLVELCGHRDASIEDQRTFIIETNDAGFLFDDKKTAEFLAEVLRRVIALQAINQVEPTMPVDGEMRTRAMAEKENHMTWFNEELAGLAKRFEPFLKFDRRQYETGCWQAITAWFRQHILRQCAGGRE